MLENIEVYRETIRISEAKLADPEWVKGGGAEALAQALRGLKIALAREGYTA